MEHCSENCFKCCQPESHHFCFAMADGCMSILSSLVLLEKCRAHPQSVSLALRVGHCCLELHHWITGPQSAFRVASNHNLLFTHHRPWHFNSLYLNSINKKQTDYCSIVICYLLSVQAVLLPQCLYSLLLLSDVCHTVCLFFRMYDQLSIYSSELRAIRQCLSSSVRGSEEKVRQKLNTKKKI